MMGLSPREVDRLTLPQLAAAFDGFRLFHGGEDRAAEPDEAEFFAALAEARAAGQM